MQQGEDWEDAMANLPLGRRKRSHEIVELIEGAIASGEFEVGSKLPSEKELAERYGVGRPSVREALFLLQQQGFVDITSGARAQVTTPNAKFLTDQLAGLVKRTAARGQGQAYMEQTRLLFEAGVAWQAAQCATGDDIVRLKAALDANAAAMGNTPEFVRTDVAFHYELTVITRNPVFSAVHDILVQNGIRAVIKSGGADAFSPLLSATSEGAIVFVDERDFDRAPTGIPVVKRNTYLATLGPLPHLPELRDQLRRHQEAQRLVRILWTVVP